MVDDLIRLLLRPAPVRETQAGPVEFDASREDTGKHVVRSHAPLYAGARVLLEGGTLPTTFLTARHVGSAHDSFRPGRVGDFARLVVTDGSVRGLRVERYRPFKGPRS